LSEPFFTWKAIVQYEALLWILTPGRVGVLQLMRLEQVVASTGEPAIVVTGISSSLTSVFAREASADASRFAAYAAGNRRLTQRGQNCL